MQRWKAAISLPALAAILVATSPAAAHFLLRSPASWRELDPLGSPQKMGPCGDEAGGAETGTVTHYAPGDTITITLDETIFHPGHYRVALAVHDRSELPPEPAVTPGATPCGSVPVADPPAFPVLADGVLQHTLPFTETRVIQVTLPPDLTCTHCTLQVLEFMSAHGTPCFYHHCADIAVGAPVTPSCSVDADCADGNACTTDRCSSATSACEHVDAGATMCDDGDACTLDACTAAEGCVTQRLTLAGVAPGVLGSLPTQPCSTDRVPSPIAALLRRADALVVRAGARSANADRLLERAIARLGRATKRAGSRRLSPSCSAALTAVLAQAEARVDCLTSGPR